MKFWTAIFWEFVQNLPPMVGFVLAVWLWRKQSKKEAIACIIVGSTMGALLIRFTEATINGLLEPILVTITNILVFGLGMLLFTIYLGTDNVKWSNWKMDVALGWSMGIVIGLSQALTYGVTNFLAVAVHSLAMALPIPLILISMRLILRNVDTFQSALVRALLLTIAMTTVISLIDYTYLLFI